MKTIYFTILLLWAIPSFAQQDVTANMKGRWRFRSANYSGDIQFIEDGKMAFLSVNGAVFTYILYTFQAKDSVIRLKYTSDIDRKKNRQYQNGELKFLNDSVMLFSNDKLLANANIESKVCMFIAG